MALTPQAKVAANSSIFCFFLTRSPVFFHEHMQVWLLKWNKTKILQPCKVLEKNIECSPARVNHCNLWSATSKQLWRWKFIWAKDFSSQLNTDDLRCRRTQETGQFSVFQLSVSLSTDEIGGKRQNGNYGFLIYCQKVDFLLFIKK